MAIKEAYAGIKVADVCRKHGISQPTYYKWKSKYGGLGVSELRPIKELEAYVERFNRTFRREVLDANLFCSLTGVREAVHQWMIDYNEERPHASLGNLPTTQQIRPSSLLLKSLIDGETYSPEFC